MRTPLFTSLAIALGLIMTTTSRGEDQAKKELPQTLGSIERLDPAFDKLVPPGAKTEVLGGGFEWTEGPVWIHDGGYLLFSDIPNNRIMKWKEGEGVSTFMENSGYTGKEKFTGSEPGTNGLMLDPEGRLTMCAHGDRCIKQLTADGKVKRLAETHEGKRFNSPNDLVYHSSGDLYFTDPPYGLPNRFEDEARELDWCGVYRLSKDGKITLLTKDLSRPNGIGFSPDEKTLYVAVSDPAKAEIVAFPVKEDGMLEKGKVIFDATKWVDSRPGLPDGMAVDTQGHLWATCPGGVLVLTPEGKLLGRINTGEKTANCTFGGPDGKMLYIMADDYICRIPTNAVGLTWQQQKKK